MLRNLALCKCVCVCVCVYNQVQAAPKQVSVGTLSKVSLEKTPFKPTRYLKNRTTTISIPLDRAIKELQNASFRKLAIKFQ